jgi:signal transduction histidine kinase
MNKDLPKRSEELQYLSSGSKIGVELLLLVALVVLPRLYPNIIQIPNRTSVTINIIVAVFTSILYEIIKIFLRKNKKDDRWLINLQLLTSVILLTWLLHVFGRINGPFFLIYLLMIMESALNLNVTLPNIVVGIAVTATVSEFIWLIHIKEITLNLYSLLQLMIRVVSLFLMRSYGISLAQKLVSEQQAHKELKAANARLTELSALKDEFVSIVSHELRTPMTAIKGYLWLVLNKDKKNRDPKVTHDLTMAYQSTERAIRLVSDTLTVSRIEAGRLELHPTEFDLVALAKSAVEDMRVKAEERKLTIDFKDPGESFTITGDADKIKEVFLNIIDNAVKYSPAGKTITVSFVKKGGMIETAITDQGNGIPPESMPNLFHKFGRLESSFTKLAETPGSGLGLYISKQIITMHKGKIWAESKVGKGTTFTFSLPELKGS